MIKNKSHEEYYLFTKGAGDKKLAISMLLEFDKKAKFKALTKSEAQFLENNFGIKTGVNLNRSDYIYSTSELISLSGRNFIKKEQFKSVYSRKQ